MLYHKINSVFKRDQRGRSLDGEWSREEFRYLADLEWVWTEKVDGTNIRLIVEGGRFRIGGRTERAQIPAHLVDAIMDSGVGPKMLEHGYDMTLFGEGYGPKIQGGGKYTGAPSFVLFDVAIDGMYLRRESVEDIATSLGIDVVPVVGRGSLHEAIDTVSAGMVSRWGDFVAEGIVARPAVELASRVGARVVVKVKHRDFGGRDA